MLLLPDVQQVVQQMHNGIILNRAARGCLSSYFFSLSIALACRLVCVLSKTASCCAHFRHSPATRGPLSALSASATCFSFFLRHNFTSSHSFWLTDRSLLKMGNQITWWQKEMVIDGWGGDCSVAATQTWGRWLGHPAFQFVPDAALSGGPERRKTHYDSAFKYQRGRQNYFKSWNGCFFISINMRKCIAETPEKKRHYNANLTQNNVKNNHKKQHSIFMWKLSCEISLFCNSFNIKTWNFHIFFLNR